MDMHAAPDILPELQQPVAKAGVPKTIVACVAGALIPGLGHAILCRWGRAIVFFASISIMLVLGIRLNGDISNPGFSGVFSTLGFIAEAGLGLLYWIPWQQGLAHADPSCYTYGFANIYIWVAGLLNMLVIVDVFDIALGRKQ